MFFSCVYYGVIVCDLTSFPLPLSCQAWCMWRLMLQGPFTISVQQAGLAKLITFVSAHWWAKQHIGPKPTSLHDEVHSAWPTMPCISQLPHSQTTKYVTPLPHHLHKTISQRWVYIIKPGSTALDSPLLLDNNKPSYTVILLEASTKRLNSLLVLNMA